MSTREFLSPHPHPRLATSCPKHRLVFGWESALPFPLPAGLLVGTDALSEAKKRPNIVPSPSAFLVFLLHLYLVGCGSPLEALLGGKTFQFITGDKVFTFEQGKIRKGIEV